MTPACDLTAPTFLQLRHSLPKTWTLPTLCPSGGDIFLPSVGTRWGRGLVLLTPILFKNQQSLVLNYSPHTTLSQRDTVPWSAGPRAGHGEPLKQWLTTLLATLFTSALSALCRGVPIPTVDPIQPQSLDCVFPQLTQHVPVPRHPCTPQSEVAHRGVFTRAIPKTRPVLPTLLQWRPTSKYILVWVMPPTL